MFYSIKSILFPHTGPFVSHNILQRWKPTLHTLGKVRDILWAQLGKCLFFGFVCFLFLLWELLWAKTHLGQKEQLSGWIIQYCFFNISICLISTLLHRACGLLGVCLVLWLLIRPALIMHALPLVFACNSSLGQLIPNFCICDAFVSNTWQLKWQRRQNMKVLCQFVWNNRLIFLQFTPSSSTPLFLPSAHKTVGINWHLRNIWGYILSWYKLWHLTGADMNREPHLWVSHTTFPFSVNGSHISEVINLNLRNKQGKQQDTCWYFRTSHLCTLFKTIRSKLSVQLPML